MKELYQHKAYLKAEKIFDFEFDIKKEKVFQAWTDAELLRKWFCPPGFKIPYCEADPTIGSYFKLKMLSPDGVSMPVKGKFIVLEQATRIVYEDSWDDDREDNEPIINEIRLSDTENACRLDFYTSFPNEAKREKTNTAAVVEGWKMFFKNLNELDFEGNPDDFSLSCSLS